MTSTNYFNETFNELRGNEGLQNMEASIDMGEYNEGIKVENQEAEENKNTSLKIRKLTTKSKRNLNPVPTECSICERMASGYIFYGVICCDDINVCKSCRFDKCILKGMYIQTTKGREPDKVLEIQTMIQNKRRELASKGKYVQGKSNNCGVEEINFVDLVDY
uniref:Nuclear receptor domain-containing protein n=1 Tax=Meloidogyne javanica TaxID=6303 RepID=A0A915M033_MELJA